ncbi:hypothetical protein HS327_01070 [Glaesserella parasuis]|nr:hypothetical protein A2U20_05505 [Glaesserella parasuis D74]KEZ22614.1 hypothetical protein HS327_01070 [Glaesserella parasuis]
MKKLLKLLLSSFCMSVTLYILILIGYDFDVSFFTVFLDSFPLFFMGGVIILFIDKLNNND